jgi:hypothetical protein
VDGMGMCSMFTEICHFDFLEVIYFPLEYKLNSSEGVQSVAQKQNTCLACTKPGLDSQPCKTK